MVEVWALLLRRTELLQRYGDGMGFAIEDMETYAHEARLPGERLVLLLLATYGDGEPTDNALEFYNWVTAAAKGAAEGTGDDQLLKVHSEEHAPLRRAGTQQAFRIVVVASRAHLFCKHAGFSCGPHRQPWLGTADPSACCITPKCLRLGTTWSSLTGRSLQSVQEVSFGVFGLGNKQYEHFAAVGKRVHDALLALGASAVVRRGDGDDDADIDEDFELWRADLIKALDDSPLVAVKVRPYATTHGDGCKASVIFEGSSHSPPFWPQTLCSAKSPASCAPYLACRGCQLHECLLGCARVPPTADPRTCVACQCQSRAPLEHMDTSSCRAWSSMARRACCCRRRCPPTRSAS